MADRNDLQLSRRRFLANALAALAAAGVPEWAIQEAHAAEREREARFSRRFGPNDQINLAVIGPGGSKGGFRQGLGDTRAIAGHSGVKVVAACDVDAQHLDEAAQTLGPDCAKFKDFRELLARKDIDAVVIGTPDHWHTLIAIAALKAGKHVYCEKPLTLTIDEGKHLVRTWKESKRTFEVGSQQRSDARFRLACELVRNGRLGKIKSVTTHLPTGPQGGPFSPQPVPSDLNWDMWLGQAPLADFMKERVHGSFRYWLDYSGGMLTDWGAHHNDIAQWGLGTDRLGPIAVEGTGKRDDRPNCFNAFYDFDVTFTYPNDVTMLCTNKGENGVDFVGEAGSIFVSRGTIRASDQRLLEDPLPASATRLYVSNDHAGNFVDCIHSGKDTICDAEVGHRSASVCHLANICLRLGGGKLEWDPKRETFVGSPQANALLSRPMRQPWHI